MVGKEWLLSFILQILFASQASPNLRMVLDVVEMWASSSLLSVRGSGKRLLLSENKWENLSKLCTNLVSNWTWQNVGEGSACIYSTVLKSRKCWVNTWTRLRCCCCCCFCSNSCFPMIYLSQWFFFFLMLRLFFTFTYASASVQPAEIQLHLLPVCYQRVRCWNEDLAGYCVDDKWKRSKHSLLVCSYSGSAGLAVVKTCYLLIKHATPSSEKKLRWTLSQCDRLPVMPAWNLSLLCWLNL